MADPRALRLLLSGLVLFAGTAALSWETLWQLRASLALGASSYGTAITLAAAMGGMSAGALLAGRFLRGRRIERPLHCYAVLELAIGIAGILLDPMFDAVAALDVSAFRAAPALAPAAHLIFITLALGVPTLAMGATLPFFGLIARQLDTSLSLLYGLNTLGAAAGTLLVALFGIPHLGMSGTGFAVALINLCVSAGALWLGHCASTPATSESRLQPGSSTAFPAVPPWTWTAVWVTGFSTFALEVAWFRSLRAAFRSTTDSFSVMLASVLLALGLAARFAPIARQRFSSPAPFLALAGACVLLATPLIERFDTVDVLTVRPALLGWFAMTFVASAPAIFLLGLVLPWLLDDQEHPGRWAQLYSLNTLGAIVGSLTAAWLLLPGLGFTRTSWAIGLLVSVTGLAHVARRQRLALAMVGGVALCIAVGLDSGVGRDRIQGRLASPHYRILEHVEGPDATVSAVEFEHGLRSLIIDGFQAASEMRLNHYMKWMGHLPMVLHPDPRKALVICFGTGQTANAVRNEGVQTLTIVDLNRAVFDMAPFFRSNEEVLDDHRVESMIMDGRAFLRRTDQLFDVITLEPMPPSFAGMNALYSREFYQDASAHLDDGGMIVQWVPFHLISPITSAAIIATMEEIFPGSFLWLDPVTPTGILVGKKGGTAVPPSDQWPGFARGQNGRDLANGLVVNGIILSGDKLRDYASHGRVITDDNQFLAYGPEAMLLWRHGYDMLRPNMRILSSYTGRQLPMER